MKFETKNNYHKLPILDGLELFEAKHHKLSFPFHAHKTFNITLVIEQPFSTKLSNRFLQATAGSIVITNPEEVHATICDNKIGNSFFTFYVSPDVMRGLNNNKPVFFENKIIFDVMLFNRLFTFSRNNHINQFNSEKELLSILRHLVAVYAKDDVNAQQENKLFQRFLQEESFEKFSLERTACSFGLNKYKFLRLFKQETGLTPNNYVILKRVEKCKELLQTQDDLLDIAIKTGFYDATHLCKHFKKITGITPLTYRNA